MIPWCTGCFRPASLSGNNNDPLSYNVGVEITLTAQWANIATVHFDAKGQGYSTGGSTDESCIVGSSFTVPNSKFRPNNQSVFFYCWSTDENLNSGFYHPGDVISNVAGDFTLYAKWIDSGHTITFKSSTTHDTVATYSIGAGAKGILPDEALIRQLAQGLIVIPQEWKLLGWTTRSISQNVEYLPGDRVVVNSDMNMYAIWTDSITVKNGDDIIGTMPRGSDYTLPYDTVTPPIPNTDWKFMGWSVTINKWNTESWKTIITFTKPVDEDGYIIKNGTIKYVYDTMEEARVITGSTTTYYHSFVTAVNEATAGSIVELLSDVTLDSTLTINKKLTLTGDYTIKIKDDVDPQYFPEKTFIKIGNDGDLTIIGPTIDAKLKYRAIFNSQGKLTIREGLVTGGKVTEGYGPGVYNDGNATFNMTGGEISDNVTEGVNATTYKVYASDLFIGPSTSAQITGGTIGRIFVDANAGAQNPQLTMDGATASVVYVEYGANSTDQMRLVSGTVDHIYVSTNVLGEYSDVSPLPGLYMGGVVIHLTIHYEHENHSEASSDYTTLLGKGVEYSIQSPAIEGYVPNEAMVSGTTEALDIVVTVTYSAIQE